MQGSDDPTKAAWKCTNHCEANRDTLLTTQTMKQGLVHHQNGVTSPHYQQHTTPLFIFTRMFKLMTSVGGEVQARLPDVGQPVLPCLGVEVRNDFQLTVRHSLTVKERVAHECLRNCSRMRGHHCRAGSMSQPQTPLTCIALLAIS